MHSGITVGDSPIRWLFKFSTFSGLWPFGFQASYEIFFQWLHFRTFVISVYLAIGILGIPTVAVLLFNNLYAKGASENRRNKTSSYGNLDFGVSETFGHVIGVFVATLGINSLRIFHILKRHTIMEWWNNMVRIFSSLAGTDNDLIGVKVAWQNDMRKCFRMLFLMVVLGKTLLLFCLLRDVQKNSSLNSIGVMSICMELWKLTEQLFLRNYFLLYYILISYLSFGFEVIKARVETSRVPTELQKINWFFIKSGNKSIIMREESVQKILELTLEWTETVAKFNTVFMFPLIFCGVQLGALIICTIFSVAINIFAGGSAGSLQLSLLIGVLMDICALFMVCISGSNLTKNARALSCGLETISVELLSKDTRQQLQYAVTRMYTQPVEIRPGDLITFNCGLITSLIAGSISYLIIMIQFNSNRSSLF